MFSKFKETFDFVRELYLFHWNTRCIRTFTQLDVPCYEYLFATRELDEIDKKDLLRKNYVHKYLKVDNQIVGPIDDVELFEDVCFLKFYKNSNPMLLIFNDFETIFREFKQVYIY